jgi:hypothetical protein
LPGFFINHKGEIMKLFISNTTKQNYTFRFRIEQGGKVFDKLIQYGQQVCLDQDLTAEQIDYIISQHAGDSHEYMVDEKNIDLSSGFIGLVYRIGSPVNAEKTATIIDENDGELDKMAQQMRTDTASVIAANLGKDGSAPESFTTETIEEVPVHSDKKEGFSENIEVQGRDRVRPHKSK